MYCWECPHYIMGCTIFDNPLDCQVRTVFEAEILYFDDKFSDLDDYADFPDLDYCGEFDY